MAHRFARAIIVLLVCANATGKVRAFSSPDAYAESAATGGGGGRWFSGSPADGLGCSVCHSTAPTQRVFPLSVSGLPAAGYLQTGRYEVILAWPEFAQRWTELRPDPMAAPMVTPGQPPPPAPAEGLTAELVAESGKASGTIEIATASTMPSELCERTRPNLQPRPGAKLYQVRPGLAPILLKPDAMGVLRCEVRQLGQRCLIALSSCGAQQIRFTWIAPSTWEGPIWFSAGFVASEALDGTFERDSVDEFSVPVVQAGSSSAAYQETLHNACALGGAQSHPSSSSIALSLFVLPGVFLALRARRRGREQR